MRNIVHEEFLKSETLLRTFWHILSLLWCQRFAVKIAASALFLYANTSSPKQHLTGA